MRTLKSAAYPCLLLLPLCACVGDTGGQPADQSSGGTYLTGSRIRQTSPNGSSVQVGTQDDAQRMIERATSPGAAKGP
jgi:hypothetical protein